MSEFTPSRRAVVRTAAWTVPAVSIAAAAPAFAVSPPTDPAPGPNLSTTVVSQPTRSGSTISFPKFDVVNTGDVGTDGVTFAFTTSTGTIDDLTGTVFGSTVGLNGFSGITVVGLGSSAVTVNFPADFFGPNGNSDPGSPLDTFVTINVETSTPDETTLDLTITAANTPSGTPGTASFTV